MEVSPKKDRVVKVRPSTSRKWWKILSILVLVIILIPIISFFLLKIPKVQNWVVDKLTNSLSKKLDTRVEIDEVYLDLKKGFVLDKFYLEGFESDTLIYVNKLSTGFTESIYSLFKNELHLSYVTLENAEVNLKRRIGDSGNNLSMLLDALKTNDNKESGDPMDFSLKEIGLVDISFSSIDEVKNQSFAIKLNNGKIDIESFGTSESPIEITNIYFFEPEFEFSKSGEKLFTNDEVKNEIETIKSDSIEFKGLIIGSLKIDNGKFNYHNLDEIDLNKKDYFDYQNLNLEEVNLSLNNFHFKKLDHFTVSLENLSFTDENKFTVEKLSSSNIEVSEKAIECSDFLLLTPNSEISDFLALRYNSFEDFKDFNKKVRFDIRMNQTDVELSDLNYFIPALTQNSFFLKNKNRRITINGKIGNRINNLSGSNVSLKMDNGTFFSGSFNTRNLTSGTEALLNIKVSELRSDVSALKEMIPKFNPPSNFFKLGKLDFSGRFDGYIENFVAYGTLNTNLGKAEMDINLDVRDGSENAEYSGDLALINFDLAKWSDNEDLGLVNFESYIEDGKGLTLEKAFAKLDANVQSFSYKNYIYHDFTMDGKIDKNQFVGLFRIKDPNADFLFDGEILLEDGVPKFDFVADIQNLDLQALKLSDKKAILKGKINLNAEGNSLYTVDGQSLLQGISFTNEEATYFMESVLITSSLEKENRNVEIESDIGSINIHGKMDFRQLLDASKHLLKRKYPHHLRNVQIDKSKISAIQDFTYKIDLTDTKNFLSLAGLKNYRFKNLNVEGELNTNTKNIDLIGSIGKFIMKADTIHNVELSIEEKNKIDFVQLKTERMVIRNKNYSPVEINTAFEGDDIKFDISTNEVFDSLHIIDISGVLAPSTHGYIVKMDDSNLEMLGSKWNFTKGNSLEIGNNFIDIENFTLTDGQRDFNIKDIRNKGLALNLEKFDFLIINGLIDYDKIDFSGEGNVQLEIENIFNPKNFEAKVNIPKLSLNDQDYGTVNVLAYKQEDANYLIDVGIVGDSINLALKATIDEDTKEVKGKFNTEYVPFSLFEMIIPNGISEVEGSIKADIDLYGDLSDLKMKGDLRVMNGAVKIEYIGEKYFTHNQPVLVTHETLLFNEGTITDHLGNEGSINGIMTHSFLKDFNMDIDMSSDDIIILNTTIFDNPLYYGLGRGEANVHFSGPFSKADMVINATTGPQTKLSIPVKYFETGYEESFIQFINKEDILNPSNDSVQNEVKFEGLDVEMNVSITPEAQLEIIFDKQLNDVLRGRGTGNVQIYITREGEFLTYGDYVIEEGSYNLTVYSIASKEFAIERGGTIRWTGDPINTNLDISAKYADLRSNLNIFLAEFLDPNLSSETARGEASRKKEIDLLMHIGGTLYEPIVNFDIEFPDIESGELRSFVDTKMRSLRTNPNSLNDQVAGLITFNTFLPTTNSQRLDIYTGATALQTATSTISEAISNQISYLLTNFINEAISDNSIFSSIDVQLGLNQNNNLNSQDAGLLDLFDPDEIESSLNARFKFLDERFSVRVGGNYIRRGDFIENGLINTAFIGDVAIEYDITADRRLKLRMYNRFDRDEVSGNPKNKSGLGLNYRKEFGSLIDFEKPPSTNKEGSKKSPTN